MDFHTGMKLCRVLAALSELSIDELRLMVRFAEFLAKLDKS
ncbi:hypothetical protein ES703_82625 [subsurface metagenome]